MLLMHLTGVNLGALIGLPRILSTAVKSVMQQPPQAALLPTACCPLLLQT